MADSELTSAGRRAGRRARVLEEARYKHAAVAVLALARLKRVAHFPRGIAWEHVESVGLVAAVALECKVVAVLAEGTVALGLLDLDTNVGGDAAEVSDIYD